MIKDSKGRCESSSHKLVNEKTKTRLDQLQALITKKNESQTDDTATLVEVNKMLQEWKAELNWPPPASSLLVCNHNFVVALIFYCF